MNSGTVKPAANKGERAYVTLSRKCCSAVRNSEEVNALLGWLNRIDNSDWMPVAMKFLADRPNKPNYTLWFIRKLERLAAYLHATSKDVNHRIERYSRILAELEDRPEHSLKEPLTSIELDRGEKGEFRDSLDGEIYRLTTRVLSQSAWTPDVVKKRQASLLRTFQDNWEL